MKKGNEKSKLRYMVVGTSCSGKTTFADKLSKILSIPHIEMDRLHWGPNWSPKADFAEKLAQEVDQPNWIIDGNYRIVRQLTFEKASVVFWLNYPFWLVFGRALKRTLPRVFLGKTIYAGNRETFFTTFFSSDSILWWVIKTHRQRQIEYSALFASNKYPNLKVIELRHPIEAEEMLKKIRKNHEI
ncbi:MAG: adenylate kinase [Candidatus Cloacimonetes bacterium]|nr:adenylate kinase [Candidatus Cloacimonadota bacterium]MCF7815267.1 adenylate kinase [Candidatus Cloacimonadota bacterium]MCF7868102.1 adenylate kinase [Candidatus Cloacimonadota bacterium]MCF7883568.1 adenylate kinase [Candidatus Cloacimonadota bacterium]